MRIHKVFLDAKESFKVTSQSFLAKYPSAVKPILEEIDFYHTVKQDKKSVGRRPTRRYERTRATLSGTETARAMHPIARSANDEATLTNE